MQQRDKYNSIKIEELIGNDFFCGGHPEAI
jgi:hypothetical protein